MQDADAFRGILAHIEEKLSGVSPPRLKREVIADYSLLYTWQGSGSQGAGRLRFWHIRTWCRSHPALKGDWAVQLRISGVIKDGYIWGRGAWDDKGNLCSPSLEAAEQLAKAGI